MEEPSEIKAEGEYFAPLTGFGTGVLTEAFVTKALVARVATVAGAAGALTEAGNNAMLYLADTGIDELDPNSRVKITVTSWDIPQNKGVGYMKEYYTVSTW